METVKLYCGGRPQGEVVIGPEEIRREVRAAMADPGDGLYRAFLLGQAGELPLGVMEPAGGTLSVRRRLYAREIAALGPLERGEARLSFAFGEGVWQETDAPGQVTADPALRRRLESLPRVLRRREGERVLLAIPLEEGKPFPLEPLFCLARVTAAAGRLCAVYAFDRQGRPLPP